MHTLSVALTLSLVLFISGCDRASNIEDKFSNYLQRVANVQNQETKRVESPTWQYPRKRDLQQPLTRQNLGLVDALQLSKCHLMELVAERNTVLGKIQDEFRNLEYQVALLKGLRECLSVNELSDDFNQDLERIYKIKWQELPVHISNTLYASDAFYANAYSNNWYQNSTNQGLYNLQKALQQLNRLHQLHTQNKMPDTLDIISYQEDIEKYDQLGRITYSLIHASLYLNTTTQQLDDHDHLIFCGENRDDTKYRRLKNIFYKYYIGELQPYLAQVNSAYHQISPHIEVLYLSEIDHQHHHPVKQAYTQYKLATAAHTKYWMTLFARCGEPVGQNRTGELNESS